LQKWSEGYEANFETQNFGGGQAPMPVRAIIVILLILLVIGSIPAYPYSVGWGYYPSGILGTILLVWVVLLLLGMV